MQPFLLDLNMKYLLIIIPVFLSNCTSFKYINNGHHADHFGNYDIYYAYLNKLMNEYYENTYKVTAIRFNKHDSLNEQIVYGFYNDSFRVTKMVKGIGKMTSYHIKFDSSYTIPLTALDRHIFDNLIKISDSLHLYNMHYLSNATGFFSKQK